VHVAVTNVEVGDTSTADRIEANRHIITAMRRGLLLLLMACGRSAFEPTFDTGAAIDPALVLWYGIEDDPADGQLVDSAGGDHAAACVTGIACGTAAPGRVGQGLRLEGSQFYRLPFEAALDTPLFTVALFANVAMTGNHVLFTKRYDVIHNSWAVVVDMENNAVFETAHAGPDGAYDQAALILPLDMWFHVAVSWDGTTKRMYVNGARILEVTVPGVAFDAGEILIGCDQDDNTLKRYTAGVIDELRLYDRVLSDAEIGMLAQP
jgi:hypothetical protein